MLESLGVDPGVELVYRALLGNPGTTPAALAEVVDQPVPVVEDALAGLVASGLAHRSDDQAYVVAPPAVGGGGGGGPRPPPPAGRRGARPPAPRRPR
jgi:hypothetical protein